MSDLPFVHKSSEETLNHFSTSLSGLTQEEAQKRIQEYGPNELTSQEIPWWEVLKRQFKSPFLYLLFAAALLSFILREAVDGIMVLAFIFINTGFGFYQEYKSELTLKLLKQYIQSKSHVMRNGKEILLKDSDIVPGDIIYLKAGDVMPADVRLINVQNLVVDESILTGESSPTEKIEKVLPKEITEVYQALNCAFSGTTVIRGKAIGVVYKTGKNAVIGEISVLAAKTKHASVYEKGIYQFSQFILRMVLLTLGGLVILNIVIKGPQVNLPIFLIFAIALAVSVVPEALPIVITFSLARGALKLAHNKVVVKRLSAIEDLGSIEILCTDKTGTITENKLTVEALFPNDPKILVFAKQAISHSNLVIDPFDLAITNAQQKEKIESNVYTYIEELPFDPERRSSSVLVKHNSEYLLLVKGAPESLFDRSNNLSTAEQKKFLDWIKEEGAEGKRVLGIAYKTFSQKPSNILKAEDDLKFLGILSFIDPLKKTALQAIHKARELGVQIKIVTGDSKEVAGFVAHSVGLISKPSDVITGEEFERLPVLKQHEAVNQFFVFARISPQQKYNIINLLQEKYAVGFLGEGINDAPALKAANVAIVVEGASDVARETADIVLLHRSLNVVIDGIKVGRETFANTHKYIKSVLSSNFGNFYTVAISSLFIPFLPMLPLQILLLNLLSDLPMIAIATDNNDPKELTRPKAYNIKGIALIAIIMGAVSSVFDFLFFALFVHVSPAVLQTNWFIGSVLTELVLIYSIRSKMPAFKAKRPSLPLLLLSCGTFVLTIILPYTYVGINFFKFTPPTPAHIFIIIVVVVFYFIVTEIVKNLYYRTNQQLPKLPSPTLVSSTQ